MRKASLINEKFHLKKASAELGTKQDDYIKLFLSLLKQTSFSEATEAANRIGLSLKLN